MNNYAGTKAFSVTHTHASAAKAEQAAPGANKRLFITDIIGSSDKPDAQLLVKEDSGGGGEATKFQTQFRVDATYNGMFQHHFETPLIITANKKASVEVDGTAVCCANIVGFIL